MSVIDEAVKAGETFARSFSLGALPMPPARKLVVVACMDARLTVEKVLGLNTGDAHVIRNAGGIFTEDALRSVLISHYLLGTKELMFIHHTDCGMLTFKDEDLAAKLRQRCGTATVAPAAFHAFASVEDDLARQMEKARAHPWIPKDMLIRGFVYDVKTGKLSEVRRGAATA
jgi:carbonic anhydrase